MGFNNEEERFYNILTRDVNGFRDEHFTTNSDV